MHNAFPFSFSSRRRHTRWPRDWSSDVCSSDLLRNYHPRSDNFLFLFSHSCCSYTNVSKQSPCDPYTFPDLLFFSPSPAPHFGVQIPDLQPSNHTRVDETTKPNWQKYEHHIPHNNLHTNKDH